jgi:hypothetical protein
MGARSREQRLFGAACVRVTLERAGLESSELYRSTLLDLELEPNEVDVYLMEHRAAVEAALNQRGRGDGA